MLKPLLILTSSLLFFGCSHQASKSDRFPAQASNTSVEQMWADGQCGGMAAYQKDSAAFDKCTAEKMKTFAQQAKSKHYFECDVYKNAHESMIHLGRNLADVVNDQAEIKIGTFGKASYEASLSGRLIHLSVHENKSTFIAAGLDKAALISSEYTIQCALDGAFDK